jgi:hypothetical protein
MILGVQLLSCAPYSSLRLSLIYKLLYIYISVDILSCNFPFGASLKWDVCWVVTSQTQPSTSHSYRCREAADVAKNKPPMRTV